LFILCYLCCLGVSVLCWNQQGHWRCNTTIKRYI